MGIIYSNSFASNYILYSIPNKLSSVSIWTPTMTGNLLLFKAATWESLLIRRLCLTLSWNLSSYNFQRLFLHISTNSVLLLHDNISISGTTISYPPRCLIMSFFFFELKIFSFFIYSMYNHGFQSPHHVNHSSLNIHWFL